MKTRIFACLFVLAFLASVAYVLHLEMLHQKELLQQRILSGMSEQAREKLELIKRTITPRAQLKAILFSFWEKSQQFLAKEPDPAYAAAQIELLYQKELKTLLPGHDLAIVGLTGTETTTLFFKGKGLGLTQETLAGMKSFLQTQTPGTDTLQLVGERFKEIFSFPQPAKDLFDPFRQDTLQIFHSFEKKRGFFFSLAKVPGIARGFFLVGLLNLENLQMDYGFRTVTQTWNDDRSGLAVLTGNNRVFSVSPSLKKQKKVFDALDHLPRRDESAYSIRLSDEFAILGEKLRTTGEYQILLFYRLPPAFSLLTVEEALVFCFSLWLVMLGFIAAVEKIIFRRGIKIRVGTALLTAFILVTALPVTGVYVLARKGIEEYEKKFRGEISRELHQRLLKIDEGSQFFHAKLVRKFKKVQQSKTVSRRLFRDERHPESASRTRTLETLARYLGFDRGSYSESYLSNNIMTIVGPNEYERNWSLAGNADKEQKENLMQVMVPVSRKLLNEKKSEMAQVSETNQESQFSAKSKDALMMEMVWDVLRNLITPSGLVKLLSFNEEVQEFKLSQGRGYYIQLPISFQGVVRYILFLFWTQNILDEPYLRRIFEEGLVYIPDHQKIFSLPLIGEVREGSIPEGIASYPRLQHIADRAKMVGAAVRLSLPEEYLVMEAMPAVYANRFMLTGQSDISIIRTIRTFVWNSFRLGIGLELLLAVIAAFIGMSFFMRPIRELLAGMNQIGEGNYAIRLDDSRQDEFGSLAGAFNKMAKGLQEAQVLGRYVSGSVKKAMSNKEFRENAAQGVTSNVTILFSGLCDFDEFQDRKNAREVFKVMEIHLNAVNKAVEKFGGDIDKVMGEKILVIFDHQEYGGGQKTAQIALSVIREIKETLKRECPLEVAMGLNSGSVISGILGAKNIRQDFTVIGDAVNLASRLATLGHISTGSRVVISGPTRGLLGAGVRTEKLPFKHVKGKTRQVQAFLLSE